MVLLLFFRAVLLFFICDQVLRILVVLALLVSFWIAAPIPCKGKSLDFAAMLFSLCAMVLDNHLTRTRPCQLCKRVPWVPICLPPALSDPRSQISSR